MKAMSNKSVCYLSGHRVVFTPMKNDMQKCEVKTRRGMEVLFSCRRKLPVGQHVIKGIDYAHYYLAQKVLVLMKEKQNVER